MKILYENTEAPTNRVWVTFPLNEKEKLAILIGVSMAYQGYEYLHEAFLQAEAA